MMQAAELDRPMCSKCGTRPRCASDKRCGRCKSPSRYGKAACVEIGLDASVSKSALRRRQNRQYRAACAERLARLICEFCRTKVLIEAQLDVDHINGAHDDMRPENFQVLCKNCHVLKSRAQGDQNGHKNKPKRVAPPAGTPARALFLGARFDVSAFAKSGETLYSRKNSTLGGWDHVTLDAQGEMLRGKTAPQSGRWTWIGARGR